MSNVLMRNRSLSDLEFYKNGVELRLTVTRFLMSENNVPKRWKPIFTFPGIELARKLMEAITAANTIYPTNEEEVSQRRSYQNEAIILCEQIIQHMQWLIETLPVKAGSLNIIVELVNKEVALLKAWRKQNKVLTQKRE
jgi:hypothetical protein